MKANPLTAPIVRILRENQQSLCEHQLLGLLEFDDLLPSESANDELQLFRKHFLVMNALYQLQPVLWEEGYYLSISPLVIRLETVVTGASKGLPCEAGEQSLREYYLDWKHFEKSSSASVEKLLSGFWQRYFATDKKQQALEVLQLESECNWQQVRAAYRRLAALHHPDRGGDAEQFRLVRESYELLACDLGREK